MRLDRTIQFLRKTSVSDGLGYAESWADHGAPVFASREDISDGERWRAGEVQAHVTTRFVVRYSDFTADLKPADRVAFDGREYDIFGIKQKGRNQWIEVTAAARNDSEPEL